MVENSTWVWRLRGALVTDRGRAQWQDLRTTTISYIHNTWRTQAHFIDRSQIETYSVQIAIKYVVIAYLAQQLKVQTSMTKIKVMKKSKLLQENCEKIGTKGILTLHLHIYTLGFNECKPLCYLCFITRYWSCVSFVIHQLNVKTPCIISKEIIPTEAVFFTDIQYFENTLLVLLDHFVTYKMFIGTR